MLSASRLLAGVASWRMALRRCSIVRRSRSITCSGYPGFRPSRKSNQSLRPTRGRSAACCDQYQTSSPPTFHGLSRQPYHPSAPYIVGYWVRPSTTRACELTASIIVRHASTYLRSPVTSSALLNPTSARGIRLRSSRRPVTGFIGLNPHPYAFFHHCPSGPPIRPSRSTKLGMMPPFCFIRSNQASMYSTIHFLYLDSLATRYASVGSVVATRFRKWSPTTSPYSL